LPSGIPLSVIGNDKNSHILATDGCFADDGSFIGISEPVAKDLEDAFRHEVLKMLKAEGKINDAVIENMMSWRHSGFNIYCGNAIWPHDEKGLEDLARYLVRASFSQERMTYIPADQSSDNIAKVIYQSKDAKTSKTFDALKWLAQLITHIPNKREPLVRYYGYYSNRCRGDRKKDGKENEVPAIIDTDLSRKVFRQNWARLIKKIYEVDPLICPKCFGPMKIISIIEDQPTIKKILKHLGLWDIKIHDPPVKKPDNFSELTYDDFCSQIPAKGYWIQ